MDGSGRRESFGEKISIPARTRAVIHLPGYCRLARKLHLTKQTHNAAQQRSILLEITASHDAISTTNNIPLPQLPPRLAGPLESNASQRAAHSYGSRVESAPCQAARGPQTPKDEARRQRLAAITPFSAPRPFWSGCLFFGLAGQSGHVANDDAKQRTCRELLRRGHPIEQPRFLLPCRRS